MSDSIKNSGSRLSCCSRSPHRSAVWLGIACAAVVSFTVSNDASAGPVYDVANDFSLMGNPNGPWRYGYSTTLGGALILHTESLTSSSVDFWRTNLSLDAPASFHNTSQNVVELPGAELQPGQFAFHPGPNDEYETARLTIGVGGHYSIVGLFAGAATSGTTTDVHILVDGVSIFDGIVNGFGANTGPSFALTRLLNANDIVDFAVGYGTNGNFFSDATALAARITDLDVVGGVPEPATNLLLGLGGLMVVALARKSSNRSGVAGMACP